MQADKTDVILLFLALMVTTALTGCDQSQLTGPSNRLVDASTSSLHQGETARPSPLVHPTFCGKGALTLNGSATRVNRTGGNCYLQLTQSPWEAGSGFNSKPVALSSDGSFSTLFELQIPAPTGENVVGDADGPGGDGMAFVLHADPTGSRALGDKGRALGYAEDPELPATDGMAPSLAIEFDTYQNGTLEEGSGNHIGVNIDGAMVSELTRDISTRLNDGTKRWAWISYDGTSSTLKIALYEELDATPITTLTHSVDMSSIVDPSEVYAGFASATGDAYGSHRVHQWVLDRGQLSADKLSAVVGSN